MELTQRLVCTQSLYESPTQSLIPEQIGFLGICGQKYPVVRGPNKIGRDPDTCNIVLKLNSISRHHAVINVLNSSEYMLMDLNSANKTKLENKTLDPYIPYPLKNGSMVQLGQVFGIFTVLQDDNDLPMTQALDIPDTPVVSRHVSKFNNIHTVPESPDVSDKDDSFIMPSQPKPKTLGKKLDINSPSGKATEQQTARKKIDNNFWNSSRRSESMHMQSITTVSSPNSSVPSTKPVVAKTTDNIYELNTQIPNDNNESTDSLFTAETQMPENNQSLNIYNMETQVPDGNKLPEVCKITDQENIALDLFADDKENDIFAAETQAVNINKPNKPTVKSNVEQHSGKVSLSATLDTSDDIIVFDEMESEPPVEIFQSQALLTEEESQTLGNISLNKNQSITDKGSKRNVRLKSDSSTDCEDDMISLSQNICEKRNIQDDDETDCEDMPSNQEVNTNDDDDLTDCEDDINAPDHSKKDTHQNDIAFEDLPTQVIANDETKITITNENDIDNMLTQVIQVNVNESYLESGENIEDMLTQVVVVDDNKKCDKPLESETKPSISPFKIPHSPLKTKKDLKNVPKKSIPKSNDKDDEDFHYASTQEVYDDLCSQKEIQVLASSPLKNVGKSDTKDVISENAAKTNVLSSNKKDAIDVVKPKKIGSDSSSDIESTPKKVPLTFMETDLPDSQEIKSSMTRTNRNNTIDLSSESEPDNDSEQCTPIIFRHKKKKSNDAKINLTNKFDIESLPTRIITRVRKPTAKALNNADTCNITKSILKPKLLPEQEENIDKEIITENLTRLKNKVTKTSLTEKNTKRDSTKDEKKIKTEKERTEKGKKKTTERNSGKKQSKNNVLNSIEGYLDSSTNVEKSKSSGRTTRSRGKNKETDKKSISSDIAQPVSSRTEEKKDVAETEHAVRRSRRRKLKDEEQNIDKNEKSKVYNVDSSRNSESSLDSSNALKRSAEIKFPSAKKAKTSNSGTGYSVDTQYVLFTAFPNEEVKNKLESLGAIVVCDVMHCTVVVTLQIKRTFKLLCAVGLGRPVVGTAWVQACADAHSILDPHQYILKDEASESRFQFDLQKTMRSRRNFLKGYKVSSTPKVLPNAKEMRMIVECSGGTWKEGGKNWLCVSCAADKSLWPQYKRRGAIVVSTELILAGVLRQKLDIEGNRLA